VAEQRNGNRRPAAREPVDVHPLDVLSEQAKQAHGQRTAAHRDGYLAGDQGTEQSRRDCGLTPKGGT
jgi:hypothetical protein